MSETSDSSESFRKQITEGPEATQMRPEAEELWKKANDRNYWPECAICGRKVEYLRAVASHTPEGDLSWLVFSIHCHGKQATTRLRIPSNDAVIHVKGKAFSPSGEEGLQYTATPP